MTHMANGCMPTEYQWCLPKQEGPNGCLKLPKLIHALVLTKYDLLMIQNYSVCVFIVLLLTHAVKL